MKIVLLLLRLVLGGVLIYAGVLKMADSQAFADSIEVLVRYVEEC